MTRHLLPTGDLHAASPAVGPIDPRRLSLLSAALALGLGLVSLQADALTLGRLNVKSALGEPLRAEIEVSDMTPSEADGLRVNIAPLTAFNAAGVNYNAALSDVRIAMQRRADGRYVVLLTGSRPLNDPFVDLLLEANWKAGRIVRDYTMLLDPPGSRQTNNAPIAPIAPQISAAPRTPPASAITAPPVAQAPAVPRRPRAVAPPPPPPDAAVRVGGEQQVTVKPGDTASRIASAHKSADISLDQMLVALLRANPDAFIGGNINRMRSGAVLEVPGSAQANAITPTEARSMLTAQSRNFGDYRRRLADNAPPSAVADADRQAKGRLQANVRDRDAGSTSPDRLTLSQEAAAKANEEQQAANARQARDNSARAAELTKNIEELRKLQTAQGGSDATAFGAAATPSPSTGASAPVAILPAVVSPPSTSVAPTPAPAASAPAGAIVAAPVAKPAAVPAPVDRGLLADLLDNPVVLALGGLLALLVGFLLYRVLGRKKSDAGDSVFLESRMPRDSFFGASGGESVDTKDHANSMASSLSYSPSQLDAGDVDPVAEADVYLAYGRDLQAEEILREALRTNPERTAIHLKLLEIHAKRRDLRAFESLAAEVQKLTDGEGADWGHVTELGRELDPGNPLYQGGVQPAAPVAPAAVASNDSVALASPPAAKAAVAAPPPAFVPSVAPLDFDLDLKKAPAPPSEPASVTASLPPVAPRRVIEEPFVQTMRDGPRVLAPTASSFEATERAALPTSNRALENDFDTAPAALEPITHVGSLTDEIRTQPATLRANLGDERTQPATLRGGLSDSGYVEFDVDTASARMPLQTRPGQLDGLEGGSGGDSPHSIKLSLARELHALGDAEGARSLAEEVEAESSGDVKAQARRLLTELH